MKQKALYSLSFDGANDYVAAGTDKFLYTSAFTISFWVQRASSTAVIKTTVGNSDGWAINFDQSTSGSTVAGAIAFYYHSVSGYRGTGSTTNVLPSVGTWFHVAATFLDGVTGLFINGALAYTGSWPGESVSYIGTSYFTIGKSIPYHQPFDGNMSFVRIYNRTLTADEILLLYQGWDIRNGLDGDWQFREGTGTTTADLSGNGNTGTLTNGPTWSSDVPTNLSAGNGGAFM